MREPLWRDPRSVDFPAGLYWEEEIVCGTMRKNTDGSITISCCINVYDGDGNVWGVDSKEIRLNRKK